MVEINKNFLFKPVTIDKNDMGDIISNITMMFLRHN